MPFRPTANSLESRQLCTGIIVNDPTMQPLYLSPPPPVQEYLAHLGTLPANPGLWIALM
jgi:hypothetical protein